MAKPKSPNSNLLKNGLKATEHRIKTKFISASDLMIQLSSAKMVGKLDSYFKRDTH